MSTSTKKVAEVLDILDWDTNTCFGALSILRRFCGVVHGDGGGFGGSLFTKVFSFFTVKNLLAPGIEPRVDRFRTCRTIAQELHWSSDTRILT